MAWAPAAAGLSSAAARMPAAQERVVAARVADSARTSFQRGPGRPFAGDSAWSTAIPAAPALDPNSSAIAAYLGATRAVSDIYEFGVPVFGAFGTTPRYRIDCTAPWGPCPLESGPVPMPATATPSPPGPTVRWS